MPPSNSKLNHVAIIMDGNGRWATGKGFSRSKGHIKGYENIKPIVISAKKMGIKFLTLYAFSTENWKRPVKEIDFILNLAADVIMSESEELNENNVKITHLGSKERIPAHILEKIDKSEKLTENNKDFFLSIAFNYGSRNEIVRTVNTIISKNEKKIDENFFSEHLSINKFPDPDIIIRTGGQRRLSNFLLWESAYSELFFLDIFWPDFSGRDLRNVVEEFSKRKRNFGT